MSDIPGKALIERQWFVYWKKRERLLEKYIGCWALFYEFNDSDDGGTLKVFDSYTGAGNFADENNMPHNLIVEIGNEFPDYRKTSGDNPRSYLQFL